MRNRPAILYIAVALSAISGCMEETVPAEENETAYDCAKVINSSADAVPGNILVRLSDPDAEIDSALEELGAVSFCRAIPGNGDNEEALAEYGLDKWFTVYLPEGCDLDRAAKILSRHSNVAAVQFNTRAVRTSAAGPLQYTPSKAASGSGAMFSDPLLKDQWHYINKGDLAVAPTAKEGADIKIKDAWRLCTGDPEITVAVIDEAIQWDHPDLAANMWTNSGEIPGNGIDDDGNGYIDDIHGINCVNETGILTWDTYGSTGHGTHTAGIVSAVNGNGTGVCGIAGGSGHGDGVRLMSCQIFDGNGGGDALTNSRAFIYAADKHADIAQCSFGYYGGTFKNDLEYDTADDGFYSIESSAMDYFMDKGGSVVDGGIIIFAAGNEAYAMAAYPGAYKGCISVTATASDGLPAYYTNYGPGCDIAAPGGEVYTGGQYNEKAGILSTLPTKPLPVYDEYGDLAMMTTADYGYMQGTSMACPHVSGIAALGLSYAKKLGKHYTRDEFISMLLSSTNGIDALLTGFKITLCGDYLGEMQLLPLRGKMGSGTIDAWKLLMQIEGTPVLCAEIGKEQDLPMDDYIGGNPGSLTFLDIEIGEDDMESLGLSEKPSIRNGMLHIFPTRTGSGKITVRALVGGDSTESTDSPSALQITRTISIVSRNVKTANGGWL